ncbi:hypothetical protein F5Y16DRAFT_406696 [Xylariaceae sp. FL0255]|nr:hypothetical protein F5Y16DRAFT_406696 [Xylariaceae sp. FL0255]
MRPSSPNPPASSSTSCLPLASLSSSPPKTEIVDACHPPFTVRHAPTALGLRHTRPKIHRHNPPTPTMTDASSVPIGMPPPTYVTRHLSRPECASNETDFPPGHDPPLVSSRTNVDCPLD